MLIPRKFVGRELWCPLHQHEDIRHGGLGARNSNSVVVAITGYMTISQRPVIVGGRVIERTQSYLIERSVPEITTPCCANHYKSSTYSEPPQAGEMSDLFPNMVT